MDRVFDSIKLSIAPQEAVSDPGLLNNIPLSVAPQVTRSPDASNYAGDMALVEMARSFIGKEFKPGQKERCADFACSVLEGSGYKFDRSENVHTLMQNLTKQSLKVDRQNLQPGDVLFFDRTYKPAGFKEAPDYTHVGIYTGDGKFVHRSTSAEPVSEASLDDPRWKSNFNHGYRVDKAGNKISDPLVAFQAVSPNAPESVKRGKYAHMAYSLSRNLLGEDGAKVFTKLVDAESTYNPKAVSPVGAQGLTQMMPETRDATLKAYNAENGTSYTAEDFQNNPKVQLLMGAYHFKQLLKQHDGNMPQALAAYNAGSGGLATMQKQGKTYNETNAYVAKIMGVSPTEASKLILDPAAYEKKWSEGNVKKDLDNNYGFMKDFSYTVAHALTGYLAPAADIAMTVGGDNVAKKMEEFDPYIYENIKFGTDYWQRNILEPVPFIGKMLAGFARDYSSDEEWKKWEGTGLNSFLVKGTMGARGSENPGDFLYNLFNLSDVGGFFLSTAMMQGAMTQWNPGQVFSKGGVFAKDAMEASSAVAKDAGVVSGFLNKVGQIAGATDDVVYRAFAENPGIVTKRLAEHMFSNPNITVNPWVRKVLENEHFHRMVFWGGAIGWDHAVETYGKAIGSGADAGDAFAEAWTAFGKGASSGVMFTTASAFAAPVLGGLLGTATHVGGSLIKGTQNILQDFTDLSKVKPDDMMASFGAMMHQMTKNIGESVNDKASMKYFKGVYEKMTDKSKTWMSNFMNESIYKHAAFHSVVQDAAGKNYQIQQLAGATENIEGVTKQAINVMNTTTKQHADMGSQIEISKKFLTDIENHDLFPAVKNHIEREKLLKIQYASLKEQELKLQGLQENKQYDPVTKQFIKGKKGGLAAEDIQKQKAAVNIAEKVMRQTQNLIKAQEDAIKSSAERNFGNDEFVRLYKGIKKAEKTLAELNPRYEKLTKEIQNFPELEKQLNYLNLTREAIANMSERVGTGNSNPIVLDEIMKIIDDTFDSGKFISGNFTMEDSKQGAMILKGYMEKFMTMNIDGVPNSHIPFFSPVLANKQISRELIANTGSESVVSTLRDLHKGEANKTRKITQDMYKKSKELKDLIQPLVGKKEKIKSPLKMNDADIEKIIANQEKRLDKALAKGGTAVEDLGVTTSVDSKALRKAFEDFKEARTLNDKVVKNYHEFKTQVKAASTALTPGEQFFRMKNIQQEKLTSEYLQSAVEAKSFTKAGRAALGGFVPPEVFDSNLRKILQAEIPTVKRLELEKEAVKLSNLLLLEDDALKLAPKMKQLSKTLGELGGAGGVSSEMTAAAVEITDSGFIKFNPQTSAEKLVASLLVTDNHNAQNLKDFIQVSAQFADKKGPEMLAIAGGIAYEGRIKAVNNMGKRIKELIEKDLTDHVLKQGKQVLRRVGPDDVFAKGVTHVPTNEYLEFSKDFSDVLDGTLAVGKFKERHGEDALKILAPVQRMFSFIEAYMGKDPDVAMIARTDYLTHSRPDLMEFKGRHPEEFNKLFKALHKDKNFMTLNAGRKAGAAAMAELRDSFNKSFVDGEIYKLYGLATNKLTDSQLKQLFVFGPPKASAWSNNDRYRILFGKLPPGGVITPEEQLKIANTTRNLLLERAEVNPGKLVELNLRAKVKAQGNHDFVSSLAFVKLPGSDTPLVSPSVISDVPERLSTYAKDQDSVRITGTYSTPKGTDLEGNPSTYKRLSDLPQLAGTRVTIGGRRYNSSELEIHPAVADTLEERFFSRPDQGAGAKLLGLARAINLVGSSLSHLYNTFTSALTLSGFHAKKALGFYKLGEQFSSSNISADAMQHGLSPVTVAHEVGKFLHNSGQLSDELYKLTPESQTVISKFLEKGGDILEGALHHIQGFDNFVQRRLLFDGISHAQIGAWMHKTVEIAQSEAGQQLLKEMAPALAMRHIKTLAAESVNLAMGAFPAYFQTSKQKDLAFKLLQTPGWTRSILGVVHGAMSKGLRVLGKEEWGRFGHHMNPKVIEMQERQLAKFFTGGMVASFVGVNVMNFIINGHSTLENAPGREMNVKLWNTADGDVYLPAPGFGLFKQWFRAIPWPNKDTQEFELKNITTSLTSRFNVLYQMALEVSQGKTMGGDEIYSNPEGSIGSKAADLASYATFKMLPSEWGTGDNLEAMRKARPSGVVASYFGMFPHTYNRAETLRRKLTGVEAGYRKQLNREVDDLILKAMNTDDYEKRSEYLEMARVKATEEGIVVKQPMFKKVLMDVTGSDRFMVNQKSFDNMVLRRSNPVLYNKKMLSKTYKQYDEIMEEFDTLETQYPEQSI